MHHHYPTPELEATPALRSLSAPAAPGRVCRSWGENMGLFPHFCGKQQPGTAPTSKQREEGLSWYTTGFFTASWTRKPSLRAVRAPFWAQLTLQQDLKIQMTSPGAEVKPALRTSEERDCAGTMPFQHWDCQPAHQRQELCPQNRH